MGGKIAAKMEAVTLRDAHARSARNIAESGYYRHGPGYGLTKNPKIIQ